MNPDFHLSREDARLERARMRGAPTPVARPVVILGGWRSPSLQGFGLAARLAPLTSGKPDDFIRITYPLAGSIERAAARARAVLASRFDRETPEVDIVGISMGGLVARLLASERQPTVKVVRLFTIATPHRGAVLARWIRPDRAARQMRPGSDLLARLDDSLRAAPFELVCYAQLRDWWVGARHTAPPGCNLHWVDTASPVDLLLSHFTSPWRWPIVLDLARRLRGESPLSRAASGPPGD